MGVAFYPATNDVERYRRLRAVSRQLSDRIARTIPARAFDAIGEALGMLRDGMLVLDSEDMSAVLADCCLYDWFEDGRNLVEVHERRNRRRRAPT
jgi:hypothetical protein